MKRNSQFFSLGLVLALAAMVLLPILWGLLLSLKTRVDALAIPPLWRFSPTLENYRATFVKGRELGAFFNSLLIAGASSALSMTVSIPAAYSFSRFQFKARRGTLLALLGMRMIPATVVALPLFLIFAKTQLLDTFIGISLVHAALACPVAIWLLKLFFDDVPTAIDDASRIDGNGWGGVLWCQILPVTVSGVILTAAFCFINSWNELFLSLVLTGARTTPLSVAVPALITPHGTYWGRVTAISTIGLLPATVFIVLARKLVTFGRGEGAVWK